MRRAVHLRQLILTCVQLLTALGVFGFTGWAVPKAYPKLGIDFIGSVEWPLTKCRKARRQNDLGLYTQCDAGAVDAAAELLVTRYVMHYRIMLSDRIVNINQCHVGVNSEFI